MGSMLGATGALYAIRREFFPHLPEDLILDDVYIPLKIVEKGYRAIFDKRAKVYDKVFNDPKVEFSRKTRTLAGNYQLFFYLRELFNPFRGKISWQFFSHKFLRLMVPFLLIMLLVSNVVLVKMGTVPIGDSPHFSSPLLAMTFPYMVFFLLQTGFYLLAIFGSISKIRNKFLDVPHMFCVMNIAAIAGLYKFATHKQEVTWERA